MGAVTYDPRVETEKKKKKTGSMETGDGVKWLFPAIFHRFVRHSSTLPGTLHAYGEEHPLEEVFFDTLYVFTFRQRFSS